MEKMVIGIPNRASSIRQSMTRGPTYCKVCGHSTLYAYHGTIVCNACKIFFKRNAQIFKTKLKCNSNYSCQIDINTRKQCPYCRLSKCFQIGMRIHMIRCRRTKQNKPYRKNDFEGTNLRQLVETKQPEQLPTLNLVRRDLSKFSKDEWNLLSNIIHCFDQYIGYAFTQDFIKQQSTLHPKLRFRCAPVSHFLTSAMHNVQVVVEKNCDFLSLSSDDRITLLQTTAEYTISFGGLFLLRHYRLFDYLSFYQSVEISFRHSKPSYTKYLIDRLDPDDTFIKLIVSLLSFSTINYRDYRRNDMSHLNDIKRIISIQDMYTSLVWKYMLYRYDYKQVVKRFSNLIRCLISQVDIFREV